MESQYLSVQISACNKDGSVEATLFSSWKLGISFCSFEMPGYILQFPMTLCIRVQVALYEIKIMREDN